MKRFFYTIVAAYFLLAANTATSQTSFSSYPSAKSVIYLDFDGEVVNCPLWNNSKILNCAPAPVTDIQIQEIYNRVAEDYRPFDINITTDLKVFLAAPLTKRVRVIVTPTSGWFTGVGGIAFVGSFSWGDDTPCFVFCDRLGNSTKMIAECCSHESGHTVGLSHQSKYDGGCNLTATYNDGVGSGEVAWAPIMGNSYYRNMSGWNNGPTPYGCSNVQDNLSIITTQNGFGYRKDDYADDINTNPTELNSTFTLDGLISTNTDKDAFKIVLSQNEKVNFSVTPFSVGDHNAGADLDIRVTMYNSAKQVINVYDPGNTMSVTLDTSMDAGTYYLVIDGAGNSNTSNYGSLGSYKLSGLAFFVSSCKASLSGSTSTDKHLLNWDIQCNESVDKVEVESSKNGSDFSMVKAEASNSRSFSYEPPVGDNLYYRLKVTTRSEKINYSNIVLLKAIELPANLLNVSTFTTGEIIVHAGTAFKYFLSDMNGNYVAKGNGQAGINTIPVSTKPSAVYVLQIISGQQRKTFKILKQ